MDWWTDFTVWLDKPSRTGPMESAKDASIGIGVIVMGTIGVIILCIVVCTRVWPRQNPVQAA